MKVIDLDTVKTLLGIADTSLDTDIQAQIPFIDSKVKLITRNRWNMRCVVNTRAGAPFVELLAIYATQGYWSISGFIDRSDSIGKGYRWENAEEIAEYVDVGQLVSCENVPDGAYIEEVYEGGASIELSDEDYSVPVLELSENATATGQSVDLYLGIPIGYQSLVAKAVYWAIQNKSTKLPIGGIRSKTMGPVRVEYADSDAKMDGRYGVPSWLVKGLPRYHGGH